MSMGEPFLPISISLSSSSTSASSLSLSGSLSPVLSPKYAKKWAKTVAKETGISEQEVKRCRKLRANAHLRSYNSKSARDERLVQQLFESKDSIITCQENDSARLFNLLGTYLLSRSFNELTNLQTKGHSKSRRILLQPCVSTTEH